MATKTSEPVHYSKYEKARIIGSRALQIASGAPFKVKVTEDDLIRINYNPIEIAKMEFAEDAIPIAIKKALPRIKSQRQKKKFIDQ